MSVTSVWEKWMLFNNINVESWNKTFLGHVDVEERTSEEPEEEVVEHPVEKKGKWKSMLETSGKETTVVADVDESPDADDVDGEEMDDVDGRPLVEDVDGEPMYDEDIDGEPMEEEEEDDGQFVDEQVAEVENLPRPPLPEPEPAREASMPEKREERSRPVKRQRMRAADLFDDD